MDVTTILMILAVLFGFYVAWNIGANDVANAIGTSVGSGALSIKKALIMAAILEFCGAFFLGSNVSETVESGIVKTSIFADHPLDLVYGMLASLLAAGIWLQIASYFGWPVSTTHSIVGAVVGFGLAFGGIDAIYWSEMGSIVASWIISPLMGGVLAFSIFSLMRWKIFYSSNPIQAAKQLTPYLVFGIFFVLTLIITYNGLKNVNFELSLIEAVGLSLLVGIVSAFIGRFFVRRIQAEDSPEGILVLKNFQVSNGLSKAEKHLSRVEAASIGDLHGKVQKLLEEVKDLSEEVQKKKEYRLSSSDYRAVEKIFVYLQIISACFMAFAHGANDVANAIGPLSATLTVLSTQTTNMTNMVPTWMLALGGLGIIIGLATWGWRVIETVGKKITELTPSRGFAAEFGAATTIVLASKLGLPISTTHTLVGAVLGVGFARGIGAINLNTIRDIVISWVVTVPIGAILAIIFFYSFKAIFP